MLTTTNITAVSVSMRKAHSTSTPPDWTQRMTGTVMRSCSPKATSKKTAPAKKTAAATKSARKPAKRVQATEAEEEEEAPARKRKAAKRTK